MICKLFDWLFIRGEEKTVCTTCDGSGDCPYCDDECFNCDGTGYAEEDFK